MDPLLELRSLNTGVYRPAAFTELFFTNLAILIMEGYTHVVLFAFGTH